MVVGEKESETWGALREGKISIGEAREALGAARDGGDQLTNQSQDLLAIEEDGEARAAVAACAGKKLSQQTVATCMEVLKKEMDDDDAVSMLVVGTEAKQVLVLDAAGSSILVSATLVSRPSSSASPLPVDYRVVRACRDGNVYTIKNGEVTGRDRARGDAVRALPHRQVGARRLHVERHRPRVPHSEAPVPRSTSPRRSRAWRRARDEDAQPPPARLVGLNTGEVRLYHAKSLVATLQLGHSITALRFGAYGREEAASHLHRRRRLAHDQDDAPGRPTSTAARAAAGARRPSRTSPCRSRRRRSSTSSRRSESARERDRHAPRLPARPRKLRLARRRARASQDHLRRPRPSRCRTRRGRALRMTAQVQGLGPICKLKLGVQNTGGKSVTRRLAVTFNFNARVGR